VELHVLFVEHLATRFDVPDWKAGMKSDAVDATLAARTKEKWRISRSAATAARRRRDRLKGQPQERQHSAAVRRDAGPTAPGEVFIRSCARDCHPQGRDRWLGERSE